VYLLNFNEVVYTFIEWIAYELSTVSAIQKRHFVITAHVKVPISFFDAKYLRTVILIRHSISCIDKPSQPHAHWEFDNLVLKESKIVLKRATISFELALLSIIIQTDCVE